MEQMGVQDIAPPYLSVQKKPKIGLALGAGAARGLAHIGVLKALDREGIRIDSIAGTSIGAVIGAIYSSGIGPDEIEEIALNMDKTKTLTLFAPTIPYSGLIDGSRITRFIESIIGRQNISDLNIPFAAVATDVMTGEEIVLTKGSLLDALRASASIPGMFTPAKHGERFLVDGGLVNPVPVSVAIGMGADIVIAVNVLPAPQKSMQNITMKNERRRDLAQRTDSKTVNLRLSKFLSSLKPVTHFGDLVKRKTSVPSIFNVILQTITIVEHQIITLELARHTPDFLITPSVESIKPLEFFRAEEAIRAGEEATATVLSEIRKECLS